MVPEESPKNGGPALEEILMKYWGYPSFRPLQKDIILSVLAGRDTLALLPTGGGKSVCFQVPALAVKGLCLVITPLIALMRDQVEHLRTKGVKAAAIHSGMPQGEAEIVINNAVYGDLKLLYLSPERLQSEIFRENLRKMKVGLIAVDESHCISQWGYDFRPPYLQIAEIREFFPGVPVVALTATATPPVVKDIQDKLRFRAGNIFRSSFRRENLTYMVIKEEDKFGRLLKIAGRIKGTGIVYMRNRRKTREIATFLSKNGITADFYHAGLDQRVRDARQDAWLRGACRVIVATNAFGMGIDKPDVRLVVHMDIPDSLEAYFQEAGRGGRDGKPSFAVMLFNESDIADARHNMARSFPSPATIKTVYQALGNYFQLPVGSGKDQDFDFEISEFSRNFKLDPVTVHNSLKFLEKEGYLVTTEALHEPSKLHIIADRGVLYDFQLRNAAMDSFIKVILRSYGGLFNDFVPINEQELAYRSALTKEEAVANIAHLHRLGLVEYVPQKDKPRVIFTEARLDERHVIISDRHYKERKEQASARLNDVIEYATSTASCRSQSLLAYFGESQSGPCGKCDVCIEQHKRKVNEREFERLKIMVQTLLQKKVPTIYEVVDSLQEHDEDKVLAVVQWLLDHGMIIKDERNRLKWKK